MWQNMYEIGYGLIAKFCKQLLYYLKSSFR